MAAGGMSFSFTGRTAASKNLLARARTKISEEEADVEGGAKDYVLSLEGREIQSTEPQAKKKEYVVPLIKQNNWRLPVKSKQAGHGDEGSGVGDPLEKSDEQLSLEKEAAAAIIQSLQASEEGGEVDETVSVPLLEQNKPPQLPGREMDELADVELRPDSSTLSDYKDMPIEMFGAAVLRGMGWKKGEAIGKSNKGLVEPIEFLPRATGRGLGAEEKLVKMDSKRRRKPGDEPTKPRSVFKDKDGRVRYYKGLDEEVPEQRPEGFAEGNFALVLDGPHSGLYGEIVNVTVRVDGGSPRVSLRMGINQQAHGGSALCMPPDNWTMTHWVMTFSQSSLQLVSQEEYVRNKRRPGHGMQAHGESRLVSSSSKRKKVDQSQGSRSNSPFPLESDGRDRRRERHKDGSSSSSSSKGKHKARKEGSSTKRQDRSWLFPNTRVRIIDQTYQQGKHYNKKVVVVDVVTPEQCVCRTAEGTLLEDVHVSRLETVIPKRGSLVLVVQGRHRGKVGSVVEKNPKKCTALVDLGSDQIVSLDYNDVCEHVEQDST